MIIRIGRDNLDKGQDRPDSADGAIFALAGNDRSVLSITQTHHGHRGRIRTTSPARTPFVPCQHRVEFPPRDVQMSCGVCGQSFALVADGIESMSDVFSSSVVYLGLRVAIKPPDKKHPYGQGKAEPVAAMIVGLGMGVAGILITVESVSLIRTPHPLPLPYTLWVLLAVVLIKISLSRYVSSVAHEIESTAVRGDAWHHLSDAITSLFAFIGISAALWTRDAAADDWAALCAAPVILFNAWRQIRAPFAEILDTAPPPEIEQHVRQAAAQVPGVIGLEKCFVRKVGFRYYVDLHVVVNGNLSVRSGHKISHLVEDRVLAEVNHVAKVLVHIEPEEELFEPSTSQM